MEYQIENLTREEFKKILDTYSNSYYNTESNVSDETFDDLLEIYKRKYGEYKQVGAPPPNLYKEVLPKYMGSLDKIKTENELHRWYKKYHKNYVLSDKIDGISALYNGTKIWTRGDGYNGTNISHILSYLQLPKLSSEILIRGELVLTKNIFERKYKGKMSNARNMVTGLLNPLTKTPNYEAIKDLKFVAYEYDNSFQNTDKKLLPQSQQLQIMERIGFTVPYYIEYETVSLATLTELLHDRKQISDYEVDGIVVTHDNMYKATFNDNPNHMVAFKMEGETSIVKVKGVEWNVSKHKVLKPRVNIETVQLSGVEINWATGHNAKFIRDNGIGKGSMVKITRSGDVIPYIKEVIVKSLPDLPDYMYEWNDTGVDIVLIEETDDVKKRKILEFFKCLEAKHIGKSTVETLYKSLGINTLKKFFNLQPKDIIGDGIREKKAQKIVEAIQTSIKNVDLIKVASASGVLGIGFGERKIKAIFMEYPNILQMSHSIPEITKMIENIKGFKTTSEQFAKNIHLLKEFLENHPEIKIKNFTDNSDDIYLKNVNKDTTSDIVTDLITIFNKTVVFTGIRDKDIEQEIERRGGKINTTVSKNTDILVTSKRYSNSAKEIKADQLNKEVLTLEEFKLNYNF